MPAKTTQATAAKPPAPPTEKADLASPDRVSLGRLSLLAGCIALSLYSVPFLLTRILSIMLAIGGIGLAAFQFRTNEKTGRNFTSAIAGTLFSAAALLLTVIGPYLPNPSARVARAPARTSAAQATESKGPTAERIPQPPPAASETTSTTSEPPKEVPPIPSYVPKAIPFPCRKNFQLVASPSPEWTDAATSALIQDEVAVCVASVAVERLELSREGKPVPSSTDHLVIHLQVVLVGTARKVDFESWGNSNFRVVRNKPTLTGNSIYSCDLRTFQAGTQVAGHELPKGLYPKLYADDYLIFEAPRPGLRYLRLELPASAFGGTGTLRFQIPKSMVEPQ